MITVIDAAMVYWHRQEEAEETQQLHSMGGAGALSGAFWGMLFDLLLFIPPVVSAVPADR